MTWRDLHIPALERLLEARGMFCLGHPQGEDVYCINKQDTLLYSLLPVPYIELAAGDSCAALGSYSPGHVTVAPESLPLC